MITYAEQLGKNVQKQSDQDDTMGNFLSLIEIVEIGCKILMAQAVNRTYGKIRGF